MTATTYLQWVADGQPWKPATPVADLRDTLQRHGFTVYVLGDESHQKAQPPEDHVPYSHTPWPGKQPYPYVLAMDVMPNGDLSLDKLGAQLVKDKNAGVSGVHGLKYLNWTDSNGNCWHESWQPKHARESSDDRGHLHLSWRTDFVTSTSAAGYDPVARVKGIDVALTDEEWASLQIAAYRIKAIQDNTPTIVYGVNARTKKPFHATEPNELAVALAAQAKAIEDLKNAGTSVVLDPATLKAALLDPQVLAALGAATAGALAEYHLSKE